VEDQRRCVDEIAELFKIVRGTMYRKIISESGRAVRRGGSEGLVTGALYCQSLRKSGAKGFNRCKREALMSALND